MRAQRAGDEAKSADKEDQHDEGVEKTSGAKIDVHVGENARENEERTCKSENPAGCAATVPEEQTHAEKHGDQGDAESVRAEKAPKGTDNADLIGQEVAPQATHDDADQEMAQAAGSATDVAEGTVFHGGRIAEGPGAFSARLHD